MRRTRPCMTKFSKRLKPFRKQPESNENDTYTSSLCRRTSVSPHTLSAVCRGCGARRVATGRYGQGRPRIWSGSLGRPGSEIDDRNHYSPWPRNPSVGEFLPVAMLSFVGTRLLLLLEQLRHRRLRRRDPTQQ